MKGPFWLGPKRAASLAECFGTPYYAYSARRLRTRSKSMRKAFPGAHIHYAMKANSNRAVLDILRDQRIGVDTVSPWEVRLARDVGFRKREIIYSGNSPSNDDLDAVHRAGVTINLDALSSLRRYGLMAPGSSVALRVNLEVGGGHHPHVVTAGPESKFGLSADELPEARAIAQQHGLRIVGLHQHIGSGIFELSLYMEALELLLARVKDFPDLEFVDAGGGFGVPYRPEESEIDLAHWGAVVMNRFHECVAELGRPLKLYLEPGRYLVCDAGVLVARVTTVKRTQDRVFVGTDSGMHHLIRPALYQSYHPVTTYPAREGKSERCFFVGPICESGDVLAEDRWMTVPEEGDLVVIGNAGAYGYAMASHYNLRPRPPEVLVDGDAWTLARERESYRDVVGR
jgi:diaminopimelate decarboxylase